MEHGTIVAIVGYSLITIGLGIVAGKFLKAGREGLPLGPECAGASAHAFTHWQWSQDGWVRRCKFCDEWEYGGDDYDGGPAQ